MALRYIIRLRSHEFFQRVLAFQLVGEAVFLLKVWGFGIALVSFERSQLEYAADLACTPVYGIYRWTVFVAKLDANCLCRGWFNIWAVLFYAKAASSQAPCTHKYVCSTLCGWHLQALAELACHRTTWWSFSRKSTFQSFPIMFLFVQPH